MQKKINTRSSEKRSDVEIVYHIPTVWCGSNLDHFKWMIVTASAKTLGEQLRLDRRLPNRLLYGPTKVLQLDTVPQGKISAARIVREQILSHI